MMMRHFCCDHWSSSPCVICPAPQFSLITLVSNGACVLSAHLLYPVSMCTCLYLLDYPDVLLLPVYMILYVWDKSVYKCVWVFIGTTGSSRVPDPISCRCWQWGTEAQGSRDPDSARRSFLSGLPTTPWFLIVFIAFVCALMHVCTTIAFVYPWLGYTCPQGWNWTVILLPKHY